MERRVSILMNSNKIFQSKEFKVLVLSLTGLIAVCAIFEAGMIVGYKKGIYAYRWQEHYEQNFGGPRGRSPFDGKHLSPMMGIRHFVGSDMMGAHGISGTIIKVDELTIVMRGKDDVEKIIVLDSYARIKRAHDTIHITDLKPQDTIVVIGNPNDAGQIEAKFIRVMPPAASQKIQ